MNKNIEISTRGSQRKIPRFTILWTNILHPLTLRSLKGNRCLQHLIHCTARIKAAGKAIIPLVPRDIQCSPYQPSRRHNGEAANVENTGGVIKMGSCRSHCYTAQTNANLIKDTNQTEVSSNFMNEY